MLNPYSQYSLGEMDELQRQGRVTPDALRDYIRAWNAGPHFTQAVFCDGAIRQFDPETSPTTYRHLHAEYGCIV